MLRNLSQSTTQFSRQTRRYKLYLGYWFINRIYGNSLLRFSSSSLKNKQRDVTVRV